MLLTELNYNSHHSARVKELVHALPPILLHYDNNVQQLNNFTMLPAATALVALYYQAGKLNTTPCYTLLKYTINCIKSSVSIRCRVFRRLLLECRRHNLLFESQLSWSIIVVTIGADSSWSRSTSLFSNHLEFHRDRESLSSMYWDLAIN